jgi:hypothetical protein
MDQLNISGISVDLKNNEISVEATKQGKEIPFFIADD